MLTLTAAREAGVKGIVYLSVLKGEAYADVPHFAGKYTVERMIEALDLPATILRPAYFIQNDIRMKDPLLKFGIYGTPLSRSGIRPLLTAPRRAPDLPVAREGPTSPRQL